MARIFRCISSFLGPLFQIKTLGEIAGWWTLASWQRTAFWFGGLALTAVSIILRAPLWAIPLICLIGAVALFSLLSMVVWVSSKLKGTGPEGTPLGDTPDPPRLLIRHIKDANCRETLILINDGPGAIVGPRIGPLKCCGWHPIVLFRNIGVVEPDHPEECEILS